MAATLATVADVCRQLHLVQTDLSAQDALDFQATLDTADEWVKRFLRWDPSASGSANITGTAKYFDVAESDALLLPYIGATVTQVRAYYGVNSSGTILPSTLPSGSGYEVDAAGRQLRLRPVLLMSPFESAEASRLLLRYDRVEIDYTYNSSVPKPVRDGTALLAAGWLKSNPRLAAGLVGERIGDYSYTTRQPLQPASGDGGSPQEGPSDYFEAVMIMLRPYRKRKPLIT